MGVSELGKGGGESIIAGDQPDSQSEMFDGLTHELNKDAGGFLDFGPDAFLRVLALHGGHKEKGRYLRDGEKREEDRDEAPANAGEEWLQR